MRQDTKTEGSSSHTVAETHALAIEQSIRAERAADALGIRKTSKKDPAATEAHEVKSEDDADIEAARATRERSNESPQRTDRGNRRRRDRSSSVSSDSSSDRSRSSRGRQRR